MNQRDSSNPSLSATSSEPTYYKGFQQFQLSKCSKYVATYVAIRCFATFISRKNYFFFSEKKFRCFRVGQGAIAHPTIYI